MKILEVIFSLFEYNEPHCKICDDSKQMEVLVMGCDTEFVECSYCSGGVNEVQQNKK